MSTDQSQIESEYDSDQPTIIVGEYSEHPVGAVDCTEGWCDGGHRFPTECIEDNCDGLVHAAFGDENWDGDYWLWYKCDKCGSEAVPG